MSVALACSNAGAVCSGRTVVLRMVRLGLIASVIPLALAGGGIAPDWLASAKPCISAGLTTVEMASFPWQADLHVAFTERPELATVRVQLVDQAELADFVVMDDVAGIEDSSCSNGDHRRVAIVSKAGRGEPVIFLSASATADYRIFVRSDSFTAEQAAALIVGARGGGGAHALMASALTPR
jgi:hypothetical protein